MAGEKFVLPDFVKDHYSIDQQVAKLKKDGLVIHNEEYAKVCLIRYSYYRLSAYWHLYRIPRPADPQRRLSDFIPGTTFEEVIKLYDFDERLRGLIFSAISDIETFMRTQVAYHLPKINNDAFVLYDTSLFYTTPMNRNLNYFGLISKIKEEVKRAKNEDFIKHYIKNYRTYHVNHECRVPIWMLTEIISFGTLRKIYVHLKPDPKDSITNSFNICQNGKALPNNYLNVDRVNMDSYLYLLNSYRNICAHHGRVWNRKVNRSLTVKAAKLFDLKGYEDGGLYPLLMVISRLLEPTGHASDWRNAVQALLTGGFPLGDGDICKFGALPNGWDKHFLWN